MLGASPAHLRPSPLKVFENLSSLYSSVWRYVKCWRAAWCVRVCVCVVCVCCLACRLCVLEAQFNLYFHNKCRSDWDKHWFRKLLLHIIRSLWKEWFYSQVLNVSRSLSYVFTCTTHKQRIFNFFHPFLV